MRLRRSLATTALVLATVVSVEFLCEQKRGLQAGPGRAAVPSGARCPWTNSLGMKFVAVPGTNVWFAIWDTRVQDYAAFVKATGRKPSPGMWSLRGQRYGQHGDTWENPGFAQTSVHPVCGVNWNDADAFCAWLTDKERSEKVVGRRQSYRLPTDWEWSIAAGLSEPIAGTPKEKDEKPANAYGWGPTWPPPAQAGNYAGVETADADWPPNWKVIEGRRDGFARTSPVGSFPSNRYGLFDMGGNVWQWCQDDYDGVRGTKPLRGGSWADLLPRFLSLSFRLDFPPADRMDHTTGFRVVITSDKPGADSIERP